MSRHDKYVISAYLSYTDIMGFRKLVEFIFYITKADINQQNDYNVIAESI